MHAAGAMLLAAQTARPLAVLVRIERPALAPLLLGVALGAVLVLVLRALGGRSRPEAAMTMKATKSMKPAKALRPTKAVGPVRAVAARRRPGQAHTLAEKGIAMPEIARRLGLSQDAVAFVLRT